MNPSHYLADIFTALKRVFKLTCEAQQQGQVGVLSLGSLGQNAAQGAQVTEAGSNLHMKPLCQTGSSWLQGRGSLIGAPLLWIAHLLS